MTMRLSNAHKFVKIAIQAKIPIIMWGPPGIGKSSIVEQIGKEMKRIVVDLRLAQLDPTDLRGIPMPNRETMRADWFLPAFWPERAEENGEREVMKNGKKTKVRYKAGNCPLGPGILFLDEIEKAPVSVKNAALQLVLDRRIGDYKLPDDWSMVCAANREEDGCFSQPLGNALANRLTHLEVEADVETWSAWARENGVLDDVIGYLHFAPQFLYKVTGDHAFPTPRSWVAGSTLMAMASNAKDRKALLGSCIGSGSAQEFVVWQAVYKNVDPEAILKGEMPNFDGQDQGFKYAVTMAVAFYLRKRKKGIKGAEKNIAKFLLCISSELRVVMLRQLNLGTLEAMIRDKHFSKITKEMMKIIC
jgi:hypothetical protein